MFDSKWGGLLQFYLVEADEFIHDGVDGKACGGVDLEFAGDVAAVGSDRMYRQA